jgi:phenylalanine-4-hydroxylase
MRKLVGLALLLFSFAAYAAERTPTTPEITPPSNGEEWLRLSSSEKLFWSIGYSQGYLDALNKIDVAAGPTSPCASLAARTERQSSTFGKVSPFEVVSGLEKFYSDVANTQIPIGSAIRIYLLQASGKDQTTIQELIETARLLGAEAARRPQK